MIIHEDEYLIVANKAAGIPVQNTKKSSENSLLSILQKNYENQIYLVHRLDQVVTGACIFAKSKEIAANLNRQFVGNKVKKTYWALVTKDIAEEHATIEGKLFHNKAVHKAFIKENGKLSSLSYKKICSSDQYDCLEITANQGRFHQIRCLLASAGMPIKGDNKYGFKRKNQDRSIHLHARSIVFKHPLSGEIKEIIATLPNEKLWKIFDKTIHTQTS